jgi:hypothetical protein
MEQGDDLSEETGLQRSEDKRFDPELRLGKLSVSERDQMDTYQLICYVVHTSSDGLIDL